MRSLDDFAGRSACAILVVRATTPASTALFARAAGIVAESGGSCRTALSPAGTTASSGDARTDIKHETIGTGWKIIAAKIVAAQRRFGSIAVAGVAAGAVLIGTFLLLTSLWRALATWRVAETFRTGRTVVRWQDRPDLVVMAAPLLAAAFGFVGQEGA